MYNENFDQKIKKSLAFDGILFGAVFPTEYRQIDRQTDSPVKVIWS